LGYHPQVAVPMPVNTVLLKTGIRVWLMEILVSGFNFFVLMNLVYEPVWGALVAHQIGMSTRIVYIFILAYLLLRYVKKYDTKDLVFVGLLWLGLSLAFEWLGSLALGQPLEEILMGWNVLAGYMWPFVFADIPAVKPSRWRSLASWQVNHAAAASQ
jgi:hypothetical protein